MPEHGEPLSALQELYALVVRWNEWDPNASEAWNHASRACAAELLKVLLNLKLLLWDPPYLIEHVDGGGVWQQDPPRLNTVEDEKENVVHFGCVYGTTCGKTGNLAVARFDVDRATCLDCLRSLAKWAADEQINRSAS